MEIHRAPPAALLDTKAVGVNNKSKDCRANNEVCMWFFGKKNKKKPLPAEAWPKSVPALKDPKLEAMQRAASSNRNKIQDLVDAVGGPEAMAKLIRNALAKDKLHK